MRALLAWSLLLAAAPAAADGRTQTISLVRSTLYGNGWNGHQAVPVRRLGGLEPRVEGRVRGLLTADRTAVHALDAVVDRQLRVVGYELRTGSKVRVLDAEGNVLAEGGGYLTK